LSSRRFSRCHSKKSEILYALCRHGGSVGWGAPAAIRIEGGSFGLQASVSSTDLILLVMNERGMKRLMTSKFTIGAEATAAAGPVGRNVTAQTDALLMAEILSWSPRTYKPPASKPFDDTSPS
jgi:SH3 domain-containing YSC84-like protein 1